ncbi:PREDICTED: uncharacterized protein LOC107165203 [Diuraphis noxia]|uniref:uncharacterized protein LOC107165203 n=1 Tax=Diuraphis noxia TaxID=143948 RepID=UPI000763A9F8|nr:PREDICTED: uncharacterized protein LOC107165203 [Diuraphis noxia]
MSIGRENYCMTAVFYNLPSILNPKHKIKNQNQTNKPYIFNLFQKKIIFIKEFINNILHTHFIKLTTNTIEENYITEINNYKKTLTNLLQVLPKKNYNSSFSTEEILQFIKNKHTVESIHYRPPSTTTVQTVYDLNSFNKF